MLKSIITFKQRLTSSLNLKNFIVHRCLLCEAKAKQRVCEFCRQQFFITPAYCCQYCGLPLQQEAFRCGECLQNRPAFDHTVAPFIYQPPLSQLIVNFKEQRHFTSGKALCVLLENQIKHYYQQHGVPLPDYLVPVPLHWKKQWKRGFNQAIFLADYLSRALGIKLFKHVKRIKLGSDQKLLTKKQRKRSLHNHFTVTKKLAGEHVAIVDDVMTTGATANALAKQLKLAGAKYVSVWAIARTPKAKV